MRRTPWSRALLLSIGLVLALPAEAVAAGNLTLPFAYTNPRITSWMDHHYPTRQADGIMIRFDGATGYPYDGHRGTDFAVPSNTPIVAADDGTVIYSAWSNDGGWGVVIDHAYDRTAYFHNNQLFVYPGQHVSRGQLISLSGSTGNSTGPHLHFEVRDLLTPWHSIDPYGWTGGGRDPWRWDLGYLWTSNPPVPYLLPLAFFGGARWDYWYGQDGPPPPISWHIRDGGQGLAGFAAKWDGDPGPNATRTGGTSGTAAIPGPGAHSLHLRVFDRAGRSADITYLYLYDVDPPSSALRVDPASSSGVMVHWSGSDALSGVSQSSIEVAAGGGGFRPLTIQSTDQPAPGTTSGAVKFFATPGTTYQLRLSVRDAARNSAPPITVPLTIPASVEASPTAADAEILGTLPPVPPGAPAVTGARQEHPTVGGSIVLGTDGAVHGLGAASVSSLPSPSSTAPAIDVAGGVRLLADGTTWDSGGNPGPRFAVSAPVRLLSASDGSLMAVDAGGLIAGTDVNLASQLTGGALLVDAALFPASQGGIALDSAGGVHAFGGADAALIALPAAWTLPGQAAAITLEGTALAPAGFLTDAEGNRQAFGSMLLLTDQTFRMPGFDPATGLALR